MLDRRVFLLRSWHASTVTASMSHDSISSRGAYRSASIESTGSVGIREQLAILAGRSTSLTGMGLRTDTCEPPFKVADLRRANGG